MLAIADCSKVRVASACRARPSPALRCRYTTAPGGDRFAEVVVFTAPSSDDDGAGGGGLGLSPASRSVIMALLEKRLAFRHALVAPGSRSEFDDLFSTANPLAPRPSPPLLADCGAVIAGNSAASDHDGGDDGDEGDGARVLLEYLCERYRAVGTPLLPSNAGAAATVRLFSQVFAEAVARPFRRLVRAAAAAARDDDDDGAAAAAADAASREFWDGWRRVDAYLLAHGAGATAGFDALDAGAELLYGAARAFVVRPPEAAARAAAAAAAAGRADDGERDEGVLEGHHPAAGACGEPAVDRGEWGEWGEGGASASSARPPPEAAYLLGRAYSLAEVAATPLVARVAARLPRLAPPPPSGGGGGGGGVELAAELRRLGLGRSAAWCEACLARPSAVATAATPDEMVGGGGWGVGTAGGAGEWAREAL